MAENLSCGLIAHDHNDMVYVDTKTENSRITHSGYQKQSAPI